MNAGDRGSARTDIAVDGILAMGREHCSVADQFFKASAARVAETAARLIQVLQKGGKLLLFGNGGSAADAQHLAAEFVNRFVAERPAMPAIALTTDSSVVTSIGNDYDFKRIFARQVEAHGRRGDMAIGLSTSGRSPNVLEGLRTARAGGLVTVGFTGIQGEVMQPLCDHLLTVPSRDTARVQEVHILTGHILCQLVDDAFAR